MLDILAQFDALGLGALAGSLLFLAGLIWLLVDNRSFEEVSRRHDNAVAPKARPAVPQTTAEAAITAVTTAAGAVYLGEPSGDPRKAPEPHGPAGPGRGRPTRREGGVSGRPVRTGRAA